MQGGGRKVLDRIWLQISPIGCSPAILFAAAFDSWCIVHSVGYYIIQGAQSAWNGIRVRHHAFAGWCLLPTIGLAEAYPS